MSRSLNFNIENYHYFTYDTLYYNFMAFTPTDPTMKAIVMYGFTGIAAIGFIVVASTMDGLIRRMKVIICVQWLFIQSRGILHDDDDDNGEDDFTPAPSSVGVVVNGIPVHHDHYTFVNSEAVHNVVEERGVAGGARSALLGGH